MAAATFRQRARTIEAPRQELDMMVLEYTCQDESAFTRIGKNCKEIKWKVGAMGTTPMEIQMVIEKMPGRSPEVGISAGGKQLFPMGGKSKEKMKNDFEAKWPFRGAAKHIDMNNFFEVQPHGMSDDWFPATKIQMRKDGTGKFEARVWLPSADGTKLKEVDLPAIDKASIREQDSKKPLEMEARELVLSVPKDNPLKESTLSLLDALGSEDITHFFARPTPRPPNNELETLHAPNHIFMEVNKERTKLKIGAGHDYFMQYIGSEVRSLGTSPESKTKMSWNFEVGPQAHHAVTIEKLYKSSKIVSLSVDGSILVEASAADFDIDADMDQNSASPSSAGDGGPWTCSFRLIGERSIKAKVFEQTQDGVTLESTDLVEVLPKGARKYSKLCKVSILDQKDLRSAVFDIDGIEFGMIKLASKHAESSIECEPEVLQMQYGLSVPTKVKEVAPTMMQAMEKKLKEAGQQWQQNWGNAQPGLQDLGNKVGETLGNMFKK